MRPILFLDIDGVLNTWSAPEIEVSEDHPIALGRVPGAPEFFQFALQHFDVRWLTAWAVNGYFLPRQIETLAWLLCCPPDVILQTPAVSWREAKTDGIAAVIANQDIDWLWIDDEILRSEHAWLIRTGNLERWHQVRSFHDNHALSTLHRTLEQRIHKASSCSDNDS